jgi:hypothetical protein
MLGAAPADVVPVRLDPDLKQAVKARAEAEHTTTSEIIREALRRFLASLISELHRPFRVPVGSSTGTKLVQDGL